MKINQLKIGSLLSYVQMAIGIVIGLVYTPVMIRLLGQSEYGLYNTVSSTISMMTVLSLGLSSSYIRFYSRYKNQNDKEAIGRLNGLFLLIFLVMSAVVFICGIYLAYHLEIVFDEGLTTAEYSIARVLMLLLTINLAISFPMSVFSSIISAHERFVFLKLLGIGKTVVGPLVTLPLLLMGYRSITMVAVTIIVSLIVDIIYVFYVLVHLKQHFILGKVDKLLFVDLFSYTFFIALNILIDQINSNVGKVILGRFSGTVAVAVYSVGYSLYTYYVMFSTSVSTVFAPRVHKIINENKDNISMQRTVITELFTKVGRVQFIILALISTGLLFFGKSFIVNIWAGEGYESAYFVTILLVFSASIALIQNLGIEIQRALNKHKFRSASYAFMAIVNIGMTVVFSKMYGAVGAAVGTALSFLLANGVVMNVYYHKKCYIDIRYFWKSIARLSVGLIIPIIAGVALCTVLDFNNIMQYFAGIIVYTLIYIASMWTLGMNNYEKSLIKKPINKLLFKINNDD